MSFHYRDFIVSIWLNKGGKRCQEGSCRISCVNSCVDSCENASVATQTTCEAPSAKCGPGVALKEDLLLLRQQLRAVLQA